MSMCVGFIHLFHVGGILLFLFGILKPSLTFGNCIHHISPENMTSICNFFSLENFHFSRYYAGNCVCYSTDHITHNDWSIIYNVLFRIGHVPCTQRIKIYVSFPFIYTPPKRQVASIPNDAI